jgi:hypothetical protein
MSGAEKIEDLMAAYQNGERKAVQGPLDYLQALALVQTNRNLKSVLKDMIDANNIDPNAAPVPVARRAAVHYAACAVLAEAALL